MILDKRDAFRSAFAGCGRSTTWLKAVDGMTDSFLHLPLKDFPHLDERPGGCSLLRDWLEHPTFDDYWARNQRCIEEQHSNINVPALNIAGWYDIFLGGTIRNFQGMQKHGASDDARRGQKLIIGPWQHGSRGGSMAGNHYFGVAADAMALGLDEIHLAGSISGSRERKPACWRSRRSRSS